MTTPHDTVPEAATQQAMESGVVVNGARRQGVQAPAERVAFTTNPQLEYFSEKGLQAQIGCLPEFWVAALLKELIENGLDACEARRLLPILRVEVGEDYFLVADEGPGIPPDVVARAADFSTRT